MVPFNIIVAGFDADSFGAEAWRQRLLDGWSSAIPLEAQAAHVDDLDATTLRAIDAVVLIVESPVSGARAFPPLAAIEEAGVAATAILSAASASEPNGKRVAKDPFAIAGVLIESADTDVAIICARLDGTLQRQVEVGRLRQEIALTSRFHGGLKGEVARMHDELQLAAMMQRDFLPRELPNLYGVQFAALWRPAHYVSGDIYDIARLDDDHVGVFIADAVGHGVPAALMTMVICRSLATKIISGSSYRIVEPSEVLERLNDDLVRRRGSSTRFATGAYGVLNCRDRTMRLAGAGHPPAIWHHADGTVEEIRTTGGLLGIFENETYDQVDLELGVGDRLLLHSDGFEQAFPDPNADNYARRLPTTRYREEFEMLSEEHTPDAMVQRIARRLDDQLGSLHQVDDLTLLCLEAGPVTETAPPVAAASESRFGPGSPSRY